jgi:hypothetical protein
MLTFVLSEGITIPSTPLSFKSFILVPGLFIISLFALDIISRTPLVACSGVRLGFSFF